MDPHVLTQKMLEDIQAKMKHIPHAVNTAGYTTHLKKFSFMGTEEKIIPTDSLNFLEQWLIQDKQPFFALLGEYGMGKTTTCMQFTQRLLEKKQTDISLPLPIYLDLRFLNNKKECDDLSLAALLDSLLEQTSHGQAENPLTAKDAIDLVQNQGALIIFDGLDEVLVHLSLMAGQRFTRKISSILPLKLLKDPSHKNKVGRILITCRTHFFRTLREQKTHFTMEDRGGIGADDYCAFTLLPFTEKQIREYLTHSVPNFDTDKLLELLGSVHNLSEMAERPYTLSLIPNLVPQIERWKMEGSLVTGATVYRSMVHSWLDRDHGKHQLKPEHKLVLMEHLAAQMWQNKKQVWNIVELEQWLIHFLSTHPEIEQYYTLSKKETLLHHILEIIKEDVRTATFLVRTGEQDFRFAHTSLQEFFLANYLHQALIKQKIDEWNLPLSSQETLDFLGQLLLSETNQKELESVIESLTIIKSSYRSQISELGFAYMLAAHNKDYPTCNLEKICLDGANLKEWNIIGEKDDIKSSETFLNLRHSSFKKANLECINLRYLNLEHCDFSNAFFSDAEIIACKVSNSNFEHANLQASLFMDLQLQHANFLSANIQQTEWLRCNLNEVTNLEPNNTSIFEMCEPVSKFAWKPADNQEFNSDSHQALLVSCKFSPDFQHLASVSLDGTLRIWDVNTAKCLKIFRHNGWVFDCAFSSDGKKIISAVSDKTLKVWDIENEISLKTLYGHHDKVRSCTFLSKDNLVVTSSDDETLRIWDLEKEKCIKVLLGHHDMIRNCDFSNKFQLIASASEDKNVRVWDVHTGNCIQVLTGHSDCVRNCKFIYEKNQLISASSDKTLRIWDIDTGQCIKILEGHTSKVRACDISKDGKYLASASYDRTLRIWDIETGNSLMILEGHQGRVRSCAFSNSNLLASASDDLTLRLWDIHTGKCLKIIGLPKN